MVVDTVGRHRDVRTDGKHKIATREEKKSRREERRETEKLVASGVVGGRWRWKRQGEYNRGKRSPQTATL